MSIDDDKRRRQADDCLNTRIAVLEERVRNRDAALDLQAREYERRLQDLNHAHATAEAKNQEYLPRSVYEKSEEELRGWRRKVDDNLSASGGKVAAYGSVFAAALALISIGLWAINSWPVRL